MSADFNSIISNAIDSAERRRVAASGVTDSVYNSNGVAQSGNNRVTDLSVEDIANAMKSRGAKKHVDNKFIENHTASSFIKRAEKEENVGIVGQAQDKISAAHTNAVHAIDRQNQVFNSLRNIQRDPFAK